MSSRVPRRSLLVAGTAVLLPPAAACGASSDPPSASTTAGSPTATATTPTASATQTPTPTPTPTPEVTRAELDAEITEYLAGRTGRYRVAVHDRRSGVLLHHDSGVGETLSTIKVVVAMAVVRRATSQGRWLTEDEDDDVSEMLRASDNDATNELVTSLGNGPIDDEIAALRLTDTAFRPNGAWWGYSTTIPEDLLLVVDALVDGTTDIGTKGERYILDQVQHTLAWQRWGVASPPLEGDLVVSTKNGWGPMEDGYRVNSVGHVVGDGRDYSMAVLGNSPRGYAYGTATVSVLATTVHQALAKRLAY